ncbi:MAG: AMP-binding protein [Clostridiales bacterium]|nr:AMP-binding protein [Clostridiales bacterium]
MKQLNPYTLHGLLARNAKELPDHECVVAPEFNVRWTWKEFDDITTTLAQGLLAKGITKGDHVAVWATNFPQWLLLQFASAKVGAVLVTVNTNYKAFELDYLLRQSDCKMLVMISGIKGNCYLDHIRRLFPEVDKQNPEDFSSKDFPYLKQILLIDAHPDKPQGMGLFDDLYDVATTVPREKVFQIMDTLHTHDPINMQYTSGTTGFPKGVMLTHHNITNNGQFIGDRMKFTPQDRLLIVVPLFHCFGCVLGVMSCLTHGSTMVLMERYHPVREMEILEKEKCTAVHGVPTMFIGMLEHPLFDSFDFSHLRTGIMAGSPCPIKTMKDVTTKMNLKEMTIVFGQTESSPGMTQSSADDSLDLRVSTVGKLLPHTEGKIIDPITGKTQPPNMPGEILTRGYLVMKGYYKMPEATKQAIDPEGWLHTGDIGTMDEEGNFRITGRLKDMIIRGGENIYPREIEEFLYTHPAIQDVQVVGVPDEKYGEEVCACCVLRGNATPTQEEIITFVQQGLSRFKAPRYILFVEDFPMTASGKIQKYLLRQSAVERLGLQQLEDIQTA